MSQLHIPSPPARPREPGGESRPSDQPGSDCLLATDLIKLADPQTRPADKSLERALQHVRDCPYCRPRYDALVRLAETEPASPADAFLRAGTPSEPLPPLDTWSGPLAEGSARAGDEAGERVSALTLMPNATCQLAPQPLYLELHWVPARSGGIRCHLLAPASGAGSAAASERGVLDCLHQHWFMVELTTGDPNRTWGFDTVLEWKDREKTALISSPHVLPLQDLKEFRSLVLTHLADAREP